MDNGDYRNLVIETLAISEAELLSHLETLFAERNSLRHLSHQAMQLLYERNRQVERQQQTISRLRDEVCIMRAQIIRKTTEAA